MTFTRWQLLPALLLGTLGSALAAERVPGTQTYYTATQDPITDVNTSTILLYEVNDQVGSTAVAIRCASSGAPDLWASLVTKHQLLTEEDADLDLMPAVTIRLGTDAPIVLSSAQVTAVVTSSDRVRTDAVALSGPAVRQIVSGLNAGKRLVVRVNRSSGGQPLTYTFAANGFPVAWSRIGACTSSLSGRATDSPAAVTLTPPATGGEAPKFTRWYFTTCRDVTSGTVRTGLVAGRAHLCDLVIETVPNGVMPVSASFRYELEYREGGRTGKLTLDSTDVWPSGGAAGAKYRQSGSNLIFTLPLNVRARAERVYTSLNVTASVVFGNGAVKRVYEPLPVKPGN